MDRKFPVGGFWGPVRIPDTPYLGASKDHIKDEVYTLIKELGINFISYIERDYVEHRDEIIDNLQMAEKYDIGIFIRDKYLTNDMSEEELYERVQLYNNYQSFLGLTVCDEPGNEGYCMKSPHINTFSNIASLINHSKEMLAYVNLFPKFGKYDDLDRAYEDYVNEYLDTCSPHFLSYDYYPFLDARTNENCVQYFEHLFFYSEKAKERGIPFWPYVEVGGYFWIAEEPFEQVIPTRGQMLWNVNMCLAFGAKGIQYFPLIQPNYYGIVSKTEQDFDRCGLIGANGKPTKWYSYVKEANEWIKRMQHILMEAVHSTVLAQGTIAREVSKIEQVTDFKCIQNILVDRQEYGAVVGVFDYQDNYMYYVVNYDYSQEQKIILEFDSTHCMQVYHQSGSDFSVVENYCELLLGPGNAAIVIIEREPNMDTID